MSNIYIQEPPTHGKVLLETTVGDIDIELWSREAPKACRNFIQLCMEGYYNGTPFHRLVKGFIVQGGDPTGTGRGGNSIWGAPFKDEFHSRLRFMRRGLVAMANAGKDDNGSQFFFTLGQTPELQNKHTIFGKVTGNTIYNMLKLEEGEVDHDEKPIYPHKITGAKILFNPFDDIVPRETIKKVKDKDKKKKDSGTKNYKLLSFGEEAEEEEEEVSAVNQKFSGKSKSSHDLTKDPKLSSKVAVDPSTLSKPPKRRHSEPSDEDEDDDEDDEEEEDKTHQLSRVQEKLKSKSKTSDAISKKTSDSSSKKSKRTEKDSDAEEDEGEEEGAYYLGKDADMAKKKRLDDLKKESKDLRTSMKKSAEDSKKETEAKKKEIELTTDNNLIQEFVQTQKSYKEKTATNKKKGSDREELTMALLKKFQKKLEHVKETEPKAPSSSSKTDADEDDPEDNSDTWLGKSLDYEGDELTLAKDANLKTNDWYALDDPRNPVAQRRREEAKRTAKKAMGSRRDLI